MTHEGDSTNDNEPESRIDRSDAGWFEVSPAASGSKPSLEDSLGAHFAYVHAQQVRRKFVHALAAAGIFVWLAVIESQRVSAIFTDVVMIVWAVIFAAVVLASIHEWRLRLRLNKSHGAAEPNGCH